MAKAKDISTVHVLGGRDMPIKEYETYIRVLGMRPLLTVQEAAIYFNLGINRVARLASRSDTDFVIGGGHADGRKNRHVMIHRERFERWILENNAMLVEEIEKSNRRAAQEVVAAE